MRINPTIVRRIAVFCTVALFSAYVPAETYILPEPLRSVAAQKQCAEVSEFFNRPGLVDPPYVLGYLGRDRESSAAFWCTRPTALEKYVLVIVAAKNSCPDEISWQNYPGGLSVLRGARIPLSEFFYREDPRKKGPSGKYTSGPIIRSEYDGVGVLFFCHGGKWLAKQFH